MKIGLRDVDGHNFPNLALMKISGWHKMRGDDVEWVNGFFPYDKVYKSKVFTFTPDDTTLYDADDIVCGGTGYDITSVLPDEIDRFLRPDYSIYPNCNFSIQFYSRGCIRACPFCLVNKKEGKIRPYMDIDEIAIEDRKNIVLMDNNILAAGDYAVEQLEKIVERGYRVDFNQALDARLVNDEYARLLAKVKFIGYLVRFGCDTPAQIHEVERAVELMTGYGFKGDIFLYTMIGGKSDFRESYSRIHYWWVRNHEIRSRHVGYGIYPYAQPYRDPDNPKFTPPQWQKDMAHWANKRWLYFADDFHNFSPRKGFRCREYFNS